MELRVWFVHSANLKYKSYYLIYTSLTRKQKKQIIFIIININFFYLEATQIMSYSKVRLPRPAAPHPLLHFQPRTLFQSGKLQAPAELAAGAGFQAA